MGNLSLVEAKFSAVEGVRADNVGWQAGYALKQNLGFFLNIFPKNLIIFLVCTHLRIFKSAEEDTAGATTPMMTRIFPSSGIRKRPKPTTIGK